MLRTWISQTNALHPVASNDQCENACEIDTCEESEHKCKRL